MRIKMVLSLTAVVALSACTAYVPAQRVHTDGHDVRIEQDRDYKHYEQGDDHHDGHDNPRRGKFCPPGQGKKGRC
jgi:hypothetical protein